MKRFMITLAMLATMSGSVSAATCEGLKQLRLPQMEINSATEMPANSELPGEFGQKVMVGVPFCRVEGVLRPTSDSQIGFEVWLPLSGWNGKYNGVGNGGFAGRINYDEMVASIVAGYATSSTDDGHKGKSEVDASWALGHPEKIRDYGWRAVHLTAIAAQAIVGAYFGESAKHSYFTGCSDGGREALMEAQRFPGDYEGIVAGAPANDIPRLVVAMAWNAHAMLGAAYFPANKLPAIQHAAQAACKTTDGIVDDPANCHPDPKKLMCRGLENDTCLTAPQVETLKAIYGGARNARGRRVSFGYLPGAEADADARTFGWAGTITGQSPGDSADTAFANGAFANIIFGDPTWTVQSFDVEKDFAAAQVNMDLSSTSPDLSAFRARGGKLILYHGWADSLIPPQLTVAYYQKVEKASGGRASTARFARLFMVPGMDHCGGGPGPNAFDTMAIPSADADHDATAAVDRWVIEGKAPERIVATRFVDGVPGKGVAMTRPLCPYPQGARYTGRGDRNNAPNWVCRPTFRD